MNKKYHINLTAEQRQHLEMLIHTGSSPARTQTHARILLKADCGNDGPAWNDASIASAYDISQPTVERVRHLFATKGLDAALHRKRPQGPSRRKLDGHAEARLIALTCSTPPKGFERWTLTLLADRLVALEVVDSIAAETVRTTLKKTNSSLG